MADTKLTFDLASGGALGGDSAKKKARKDRKDIITVQAKLAKDASEQDKMDFEMIKDAVKWAQEDVNPGLTGAYAVYDVLVRCYLASTGKKRKIAEEPKAKKPETAKAKS